MPNQNNFPNGIFPTKSYPASTPETSKNIWELLKKRVAQGKTGARWMIDSLTTAMKENQEKGLPVHEWDLAKIPQTCDWSDNYKTVEQFMATDLFTVRACDGGELAINIMNWRRIRHVPIEDDAGKLLGIVSHRDLFETFALGKAAETNL